jgi:hypothetical protein
MWNITIWFISPKWTAYTTQISHLFFYMKSQINPLKQKDIYIYIKAQQNAWTPRYLLGLASLFSVLRKTQKFRKAIGSSVTVLIVGIWLAVCVVCS